MTDSKKILVLTLSLEGGGAERILSKVVRASHSEFNIILVSFYRKGRFLDDLIKLPGLKYYSINAEKGNTLSFALRLRKIIRSEKPGKILSFLYYPNIIAYLATLCMDLPLILSERSNHRRYLTKSFKHRIWRFLLLHAYKKAQFVVTVSEDSRNSIIADFKTGSNKTITIHNGISFPEIELLKNEPIEELEIDPGLKYILAVGSFNKAKNYDLLVDSFRILKMKHDDLRLIILGEGELREKIRSKVTLSGLSEYVYMPGYNNNPYKFMSVATCYVLSSSWEGFPNALIEAMYVNGHIVSTDCQTGPAEIITSGVDGLLCAVDDRDELASALEKMCYDSAVRERVYANSRKTVTKFDDLLMIQKYRQLFTTI